MSWRTVIVGTLSLLMLAVIGPPMFARFPTAYTGASVAGSTVLTVASVDAGSPAARAGLRAGDVVGCINTRDYLLLTPLYLNRAYEPDAIHLCVKNSVPPRDIAFAPVPGPLSSNFYQNTAMQVLRVLSYVVFLFVGGTLVVLRPSAMTWLLFGYCFLSVPAAAPYQADTTWPPLAYTALLAVLAPTSACSAVMLFLFTLLVPEERVPQDWRGWAFRVVAIGGVAYLAWFLIYRLAVVGFIDSLDPANVVLSNVMTYGVACVIVLRLLKMEPAMRARFWWVAVAIVIGVVTNDLRQGKEPVWPGIYGTLTMIMPLTLMYAIVRRHVIDVRFVISKAVVYGTFVTAIVGIVAIADWATSEFLAEMRFAIALDVVIAIVSGLLMHRVTPVLEGWVDSVVYRRKHAAEIYLRRLSRTLPRAQREETIDRALVEDPYAELEITMAALFRKHGNVFRLVLAAGPRDTLTPELDRDHDIIRFLATERSRIHIEDLNDRATPTFVDRVAAVAIPIFNGDDLTGFTLYGVHRDGTRLDPDEAEVLEVLAESASQAYVRVENSQLRALVGMGIQPAASS